MRTATIHLRKPPLGKQRLSGLSFYTRIKGEGRLARVCQRSRGDREGRGPVSSHVIHVTPNGN